MLKIDILWSSQRNGKKKGRKGTKKSQFHKLKKWKVCFPKKREPWGEMGAKSRRSIVVSNSKPFRKGEAPSGKKKRRAKNRGWGVENLASQENNN